MLHVMAARMQSFVNCEEKCASFGIFGQKWCDVGWYGGFVGGCPWAMTIRNKESSLDAKCSEVPQKADDFEAKD
eukprot:3536299-Amphidinium_carterae.1